MKKITAILALTLFAGLAIGQTTLYVAAKGDDNNKGTRGNPLGSLEAAVSRALALDGEDVFIYLREGVYSPATAIVIDAAFCRLRSLTISAYRNEKVTLNGARPIQPDWRTAERGMVQTRLVLNSAPDRLIMNDQQLPMARYPDFDSSARVFNGTAEDAISRLRVSKWKNPAGGYVHGLHQGEWGGFHYRITGKDENGDVTLEGGWQNNRPAPLHKTYRFVENIFEELDAPGEWYYDMASQTLYLYPPRDANITKAQFSVSHLDELIVLKGSETRPLRNVTIRNIRFTGTNRTFMQTREPLLRSDWTIYRGGAILMDGTEHVTIAHCVFDNLGGNAVFVSNYNRDCTISDNHIYDIGASAIAFVGNPDAVRSPAFRYEQFVPWDKMDYEPGPKTNNYPKSCTAKGNLIHNIGFIEKQVAGVQIAMSSGLQIANNTIYEVPRAGINIGDGCWGGHLLEFNDVFNTVLETGDHGAFNSWGRDRFWRPERSITDSIVTQKKDIELLDAMEPVVMRNNRFHCEHGWDIDLDDGSSNYHIYNNLCLNGGLKLREGYFRVVSNNILLNNTFHPHVWYNRSMDIFTRNIVSLSYAPIQIKRWGLRVDSNFFLTEKALQDARENGTDSNSIYGDPQFIDPAKGDFRVKAGSPAQGIGFENFPMQFGVTDPELQRLAKKAPVPELIVRGEMAAGEITEWMGARLKNIETLGERSAAGLPDNKGVLVVSVEQGSVAAKGRLQSGDVIIRLGGESVGSVNEFMGVVQKIRWMGSAEAMVVRNQQEIKTRLGLKD